MITAHSDDVNLPPGRYQISTVMKGKRGKARERGFGSNPYKSTRPFGYHKNRDDKRVMVEKLLLDAAIEDPDELQEFWIRPVEELQC